MNQSVFWLSFKEKEIWLEWLNKLPTALNDVYAHPDYVDLHADQERTSTCFLFIQGKNIFLYPFLLQKTPFLDGYYDITTAYGYGGPLFNTSNLEFLAAAYSCFHQQAKERNVVAELIKFNPLLDNHADLETVFPGNIVPICNTVFVEVDLDEEHQWTKEYTAANRKCINKAKRSDVTVRFTQDDESWIQFDQLYAETMKFNNAAEFYFFSPAYFQGIRKSLALYYILSTAIVDEQSGACMIILHGLEYAYCHLIGTDRAFQKIGINNYLHHQCIEWCKQKGIKRLLIGGGRTNADDDSLLKFKMSFSKQLKPLHVGEYVLNEPIYRELCKLRDQNSSETINSSKLLKYRF
jgi:GNAT superfamily N-acetyltransferase